MAMSDTRPPSLGTALSLVGLLVLVVAAVIDELTFRSPSLYFIAALFFLMGYLLTPHDEP